jgi:hypothetical protein
MTDYGFPRSRGIVHPSNSVQERKAARKNQLKAVFLRRAEIYKRHYKKMQLQADSEVL